MFVKPLARPVLRGRVSDELVDLAGDAALDAAGGFAPSISPGPVHGVGGGSSVDDVGFAVAAGGAVGSVDLHHGDVVVAQESGQGAP
jgi:hypothetical protein